ncbi:hypothetical protein PISMIDRAFT_20357 [Pisolithus microcarpus 441]|uniref:Uncharacterized protein n=1 Tax=Pisolithus microcarpus 441 TaxID=765257 RepID=A0A0C9YJG0_9AGAM|nr:hypothetical protein PISMIDRAFT_20357 [Pisolithus microcarpus 441]
MAPKSNKGSALQKKNSHSTSKPLEPNKDREDLYGDDPPPLERTDGYQQAQSSETIVQETPNEADITIILDDRPALTKLTTETALVENMRAEGSGKGKEKEKEGPDTRKKPPTFPKVTRYAPSESYMTSWICLTSKAHTRELARKAEPPHAQYEGKSTTKTSLRDMTTDMKTLHEERTLMEWRQPDINQLMTGWIAISCLTWEEVSNKKTPMSGELAQDTQAMTQVMTQTTTQMMIWTRITIEEIIVTIVTMIAGEEDPQLLLVETREMTRRRNVIANTEGDCKEFTHTKG